MRGIGQRVARRGLLEPHDGDDVAGADRGQLLTLVGVHLVDLADPLLAVLGRVDDLGAGVQGAGVHADEGQLAQVRVGRDLERQPGEGVLRVRVTLGRGDTVGQRALDGADVQR